MRRRPRARRSSGASSTPSSRRAEPRPESPSRSRGRLSRSRTLMIKDFLHRLLGARTSPSNDYLYRTRLPSELLGVFFDATIEVHALLDQTQPALEARMFRKLEDAAS